jgi:D-serine deaminase-like pyridoxal phosphate-dependent protein
MTSILYPQASRKALTDLFVDRSLSDVAVPAAVLDISKIKQNCKLMLAAVEDLQVSFRAHIKTHKTTELAQLQVGEECKDVRLIVSTLAELEHLLPLLLDFQKRKAKVNVLFGLPIGVAHVPRLAELGKVLGPNSISIMVDNTAQLPSLLNFKERAGFAASIFIKTDAGYHRAGIAPDSSTMIELVKQSSAAEEKGDLHITGFYAHDSRSYGGNSPDDAMNSLKVEIDVCRQASQHIKSPRSSPLVVSVGDTPTALAIQNIRPYDSLTTSSAKALQDTLQLTQSNLELEIHAGVYPLFDVQQVAAQSRALASNPYDSIAVSILTEVCSLYPDRTEHPEALVSAGCLALGREPCKGYPGWGVVSPWGMPDGYNTSKEDRVIVGRISQEHGVLVYETPEGKPKQLPVEYGQKLRIWPNHACIALASFDYYFIIDSSTSEPDKIVDVWVSCRGW